MRNHPVTWALLLLASPRVAAEPADAGLQFFEAKVRPVLVQHCYQCHSAHAKKLQGQLLLDRPDGIIKVVVPFKPEQSPLIQAVQHIAGLEMPPRRDGMKQRLPEKAIADLATWVKRGAPYPRDRVGGALAGSSWSETLEKRRDWWSLQLVRKPVVPPVRDTAWSKDPLDRFILARLEKRGLKPAAPADRCTLMRRLSLVLTGLPPRPDEVEAFLRDDSPTAYANRVDRLLASSHYGEQWAKYWLDVVRFSETHGVSANYEVHNAWAYRDYVIRAYNQDVPYDQFIRENIAGDLLPNPRWNLRDKFNESAIGPMFFRFGEIHHDCVQLPQLGFDVLDNQIDTLGKAFQATTVACARCHDHKFDAVSTKDYHRWLGILRSSRPINRTIDMSEVNAQPIQRLKELKRKIRQGLGAVWLREARDIGRYLLAARAKLRNQPNALELAGGLDPRRVDRWVAALNDKQAPYEEPWTHWAALISTSDSSFAAAWQKQFMHFTQEERTRREFNRQFQTYADFRRGRAWGWQEAGHGLRNGPRPAGDLVVHPEGEALLKAVLPAGYFTHTLSEKLNGTLRSQVLPAGAKYVSFAVMGQHGSAVRLVVNNCQLSYKHSRYLLDPRIQWLTLPVPEDSPALRVYVELMTKFDNPKFPDPLSMFAGDKVTNYLVPWEQAASNPRSFWGVTHIVVHAGPEPPKTELSHLRPLFAGSPPASMTDWAARYTAVAEKAIQTWEGDWANDDVVRWIDGLLQRGLLSNRVDLTPRLAELSAQYRATEKELKLPRIVAGIEDFDAGFDQPVFKRGDWTQPSEEAVPRGFLEVFAKTGERFHPTGSGRLELAERIASPENPLTARVMVNRIYQHVVGEGIVHTVDDFGRLGERPTPEDQELLDYLAACFVEDGCSVKRLVRRLVLTRTFQMANRSSKTAQTVDPQNRLLHHYPARRMDAEMIRDAILAASGRLDRTLYGPSIEPYREKAEPRRRLFVGPLDGNGRRSLYLKKTLLQGPKFLSVFDFPGGGVTQGRRDTTNVPAQALALLNDPFVIQQAAVWAGRLQLRPDKSVGERIEHMFQVALGRAPKVEERASFGAAVARLAGDRQLPAEEILKSREIWQVMAHALINCPEFIYVP